VSYPTAKRIAVPDNKLLTRHRNGLGFIAMYREPTNFTALYLAPEELRCRLSHTTTTLSFPANKNNVNVVYPTLTTSPSLIDFKTISLRIIVHQNKLYCRL
jgi:hypothetical protein